ncbi:rhomboid family intramembrane serine protease [uncultured Proteiniphilum sp.]|uniref:rhomboid family intramembrane serine protease n=1 Tax=uncultured Proteiniphilum sp. TaxID=497637 RepID=UPI00260966FA|nr:rhomboid family intramembrane serine protease [uncultured Proteiniphilum sp.]
MNVDNLSWHTIEKKRMRLAVLPAIVFIVLIWLVFIVDYAGLFKWDLSRLGILPGTISGLIGIIFSPLIHTSFSHLLSNTLPLLILIWFLFYFYSKIAFGAFAWLWLLSGLLTWIIGRGSYHVGASGLVFALLFFLFFSGLVRKYIPLVAVSLVVAFIYGSTIWSILPITEWVDTAISWEGHLAGAISGLLLAFVFRKEGPQKPVTNWEGDEDYDTGDADGESQ